jgi:hypothetical protein
MSLPVYSISFGGFRIRVHDARGENVRPHVSLEGPIAKYIVANDAQAHLDLTIETLKAPPIPGRTLLFDSGGVWRLFDDGDCYRIECRVYGDLYKIAFLSKDLSHGTVKMVPYDVTTPYPLQYPLDEVILNLLLPRHGGVELHACGLVDPNGNGYLFAGNSGAGKTTTARLWQHDAAEILSDDRIVVRHEEGAWRMYGTPWHGEADICSPSHARLHRIFLLEQAAYNAIDPISPAGAVARMLSCTFPPFHDAGGLNAIAGTLADISADVPVTRLSFVNDRSAVDFIRGAFEVAA